jgi:Flp pilus assembly protein TadG
VSGARPPTARRRALSACGRVEGHPWVRDERGSAPVELVILAGVSFLFIAMIVFVGRLNVGSAHTEAAARSAAREISVARNPRAVVDQARSTAAQMVEEGTAMCRDMSFDAQIDEESVVVSVDCRVDVSEATLLRVPGTMTVSGEAREVIDQFREVEP